jgi:hypothetical protein
MKAMRWLPPPLTCAPDSGIHGEISVPTGANLARPLKFAHNSICGSPELPLVTALTQPRRVDQGVGVVGECGDVDRG